jgi:hypothetical protein
MAHAGSLFMLCLRQFAFPRNALMLFVCTFDAIFELATVLRELLGYFVDAAWIAPRGERRIPLSFPTNIAESNFSVHTGETQPLSEARIIELLTWQNLFCIN